MALNSSEPTSLEGPNSRRPILPLLLVKAPHTNLRRIVQSANTKREELDKRHTIRQDAKILYARQSFAWLWHEQPTVASQASSLVVAAGSAAVMTRYGETIYTLTRRMIVVREIPGHWTCIPIGIYTNTNAYPKKIPMASDGKVLQAPQTSELIPDSLVSG